MPSQEQLYMHNEREILRNEMLSADIKMLRSLSLCFALVVNFMVILSICLDFEIFPNISFLSTSIYQNWDFQKEQIAYFIYWIGKINIWCCISILLMFLILRCPSMIITFWQRAQSSQRGTSGSVICISFLHQLCITIMYIVRITEFWHCIGYLTIWWLGFTFNHFFYPILVLDICFVHQKTIKIIIALRKFLTFLFTFSFIFIQLFEIFVISSNKFDFQGFCIYFSILTRGSLIILFELCTVIVVFISIKHGCATILRKWCERNPEHSIFQRIWRCIVKSTSIFRIFDMWQSAGCLTVIMLGINAHPVYFNLFVLLALYTYFFQNVETIIIRLVNVWLAKAIVCLVIIYSVTNISSWIYSDEFSNECKSLYLCTFGIFNAIFKRNDFIINHYFQASQWVSSKIFFIPSASCFKNKITENFTVNKTEGQNLTSVEISTNFLYDYLELKDIEQEIPCMISLKGMNQKVVDVKIDRQKLDIICIVDNSGSMHSRGKFDLTKKTLNFLLTLLNDSDRLSIVAFNSTARIVIGLTEANEEGKIKIANKIKQMTAHGDTIMHSGLEKGLSIASEQEIVSRTTAILILSDGKDPSLTLENVKQFSYKFKSMIKGPYFIHTFGYGTDHDSKMMQEISSLNNGNFYYIEKPEDIAEAFATCLGDLATSTFEALEVELIPQPCSVPFSISKVYSENGKNQYKVPLLLTDDSKDLVFVLNFPPYTGERKSNEIIRPIKVSINKSGENKTTEIDLNILVTSEGNGNKKNEANGDVLANYYRCKGAEILRNVINLADNRYYKEASRVARKAAEEFRALWIKDHVIVQALIHDLEDASKRASSKNNWDKGGRAQVVSVQASHFYQKASNNVQIYKNSYQDAYSDKAADYFGS
ncbi:unnamed protein product [Blepharisma stoltei]|uniref:VWFA domain-containing protein n=1 Tax=Blepharisma stoltei TaxID=1481888 RepID=A0AAU9IUA9_9CILI|nr:unnamed protein product [Blepharisma stoltei]